VADAPGAGESLIKKEPDLPAYDPIVSNSTSGWMLVSALLLTLSIAWALYDEAFGQRPWKGMQREFVARYTRYLNSIKANSGKTEAEIIESPEYQQLKADEDAARAEVKDEMAQIDVEVARAQRKLDAVTDTFQNQRGRLTVINYNVETSQGSAKDRYRRQAEQKRQEQVTVELPSDDGKSVEKQRLNYAQLEKLYDDLREQKATGLGRKAELLKKPSELANQIARVLNRLDIFKSPLRLIGALPAGRRRRVRPRRGYG